MPEKLPHIVFNSPEGIEQASAGLRTGKLVAFPTETVYGLGADARDDNAVAAVYAAKGRPSFNPLIVHVANVDHAEKYCKWSNKAQDLADAFWPGPLSLVLPLQKGHGLSPLVTAGLETLAIRVPSNPAARALLSAFGGPVAAPSANPSGKISPTTAQHVADGLGTQVDVILDAGPCSVGLESTILGLFESPVILRPGGISAEEIEGVLGTSLKEVQTDKVIAPGQLQSHYAPSASVRLNATKPLPCEVFLGFGTVECDFNLSPSGDLVEAATALFSALHQLDVQGKPIAVAPIPETGIGVAINDRLKRAAAPR